MATSNITTTEQTEAMRNAETERQNEIDAGNGVEDSIDGEGGEQPRKEPTEDDPPQRTKPIARSPQDDARAAIANRFKRGAEDVPFNGDMTDPEMLYGKSGRTEPLEPDEDPSLVGDIVKPAAEPPQKRVLKVRGQDIELTDDEILERARKVTSADSYLEEARKLLEEAKTIKAERAGRDRQPPDGRSSTQDDEQNADDQTERTRPPAPDFKSVVDKIQFGDPEEAARELEAIVDQRVSKNVDESQATRLFNNDLAKSQKALKDFQEANPELAADAKAHKVIEAEMYGLYKEDMLALGVDESQIPTDPRTLANWHRFYKINGYEVRSTPELLNKAKENFEAWRGPKATPQPVRKEAPRVQVNVDRTERRMAIPNQPTRTVAPRRDITTAPAKTPGSDVVAQMRKARGQLTAG